MITYDDVAEALKGKTIERVEIPDDSSMVIYFTDGFSMELHADPDQQLELVWRVPRC